MAASNASTTSTLCLKRGTTIAIIGELEGLDILLVPMSGEETLDHSPVWFSTLNRLTVLPGSARSSLNVTSPSFQNEHLMPNSVAVMNIGVFDDSGGEIQVHRFTGGFA